MVELQQFMRTSGATDSVWVNTEPYSSFPRFDSLKSDVKTDVCIVNSGISGVTTAYELSCQGLNVTLTEARDILSRETGRTSGRLSSDIGTGYSAVKKKHEKEAARLVAELQQYAIQRVGQIDKELNIECEYRALPGYNLSQYLRGAQDHVDEMAEQQDEAKLSKELGLHAEYR